MEEAERDGQVQTFNCNIMIVSEDLSLNQDFLRKSFAQLDKTGDVTVVGGADGSSFRTQSLVLAAACPFFFSLLKPHFDLCLEEETKIIFPEAERSDLQYFLSYIYGLQDEIKYTYLLNYIQFNQEPKIKTSFVNLKAEEVPARCQESIQPMEEDVCREPEDDLTEEFDDFDQTQETSCLRSRDVRKLILENSMRITYDSPNTISEEINLNFLQVKLDNEVVPFLLCRYGGQSSMLDTVDPASSSSCLAVLKLPKNDKNTMGHAVKHLKLHQTKIEAEDKENKKVPGDWDKYHIEQIKCELEVPPTQKTKNKTVEDEGISKIALETLIESNSPRVEFAVSQTHSNVWKKFHKILLDKIEVPFVSCINCQKVYTHDRSLGTSSLLRHVCYVTGKKTDKGNLPKLLVQELVNTKSPRISRAVMEDKFNKKLTDVTCVFERILVDNIPIEFIACRYCAKLFLMSNTKTHINFIRKIEMHECYIKNAPCNATMDLNNPQDEKQLRMILLRQPHRIQILEKVKLERYLSYFQLDGRRTNFTHCIKCQKFIPLSSLNFNDERLHRCHRLKTSEHRIKAVGKKTHTCDKCYEDFKSEHFLEIHRRRVHGDGSLTVMCSYCAKEFPTERLAKKHEINIHHPEISKKFKCTYKDCTMAFHDRSKLRLHTSTHTMDQKPYVCELCGKGFNWVGSFKDHMDMHTGNKKYACDICSKLFTKRNTLNNHRRLHTGERPFLCPAQGCGMTFVQRTACKTHAKKKHGIVITVYTRNPDVPRSAASIAQMQNQKTEPEPPVQQKQTVPRFEVHQIQDTGGRLLVEPEQLEHLELVPAQFLPRIQGQAIQIAQLQGQIVHILPQIATTQVYAEADDGKQFQATTDGKIAIKGFTEIATDKHRREKIRYEYKAVQDGEEVTYQIAHPVRGQVEPTELVKSEGQ